MTTKVFAVVGALAVGYVGYRVAFYLVWKWLGGDE